MTTTRARSEMGYAGELLVRDYLDGHITDMELLGALRKLMSVYKLLNR